jgi:hypothetical protein
VGKHEEEYVRGKSERAKKRTKREIQEHGRQGGEPGGDQRRRLAVQGARQ